jgi:hypothetical protein
LKGTLDFTWRHPLRDENMSMKKSTARQTKILTVGYLTMPPAKSAAPILADFYRPIFL